MEKMLRCNKHHCARVFKIKGCSPCTCVILFKSLNDEKSGGPIKKIIRYTITEKQIEQLDNKNGIQFARSDCF